MNDRASLFIRFVLLFSLGVLGCGRSALVDESRDGGRDAQTDAPRDARTDGAVCNADTCPSGCCDSSGVCRPGVSDDRCGLLGAACTDCGAAGFDFCDSATHACGRDTTRCNGATCPGGCCIGSTCFGGLDPNACGIGGETCDQCATQGLSCDPGSRSCTVASCGPQNCPGCCFGNGCVSGSDPFMCGSGGDLCRNCAGLGLVCTPTSSGGVCTTSACGPQNCKGCCSGNTCVNGTDDFACGTGGKQCTSCSSFKEQCMSLNVGGGTCVPSTACGPQNCKGCCNGDICMDGTSNAACGVAGQFCQFCGTGRQCANGFCQATTCNAQSCPGCCTAAGCEGGFLDTACGSGGVTCSNCAAQGRACETSTQPRLCKAVPTTCPAPYPGCGSNVTTSKTPVRHVCSANELLQARAACTQANSPGCQAFFTFEKQVNLPCATCLQPFDVPFDDATGILLCVAPFVDAACNHSTGCFTDCRTRSCAQCPPGTADQCRNNVQTTQCSSFTSALQCAIDPLFGGAATFCNPQNYPTFGAWLQGVGGHFCGP